MSQDSSTPQQTLNRSRSALDWEQANGAIAKSVGFSVESYADRLMDDLFHEVERSLEGGQEEGLATPELPVAKTAEASLGMPLVVQPPTLPLTPRSAEVAEVEMPPVAPAIPEPRQTGRSYDRLLLGLGCVAVVGSLTVWLLQELKRPVPLVATSPASSPVSAGDSQFSAYVRQALQTIDQRSQSTKSAGRSATPLPTVAVPTPPAPPSTPPRRPATGLDRLIPLPPLPAAAPLPPIPVAAQPSAAQSSAAQPPAIASSPTTIAKASTPVPTVTKVLVGIMELGDRSAALVEVGGVVQRFRVGESISSSGWTIVEVSKNQAVIRRNGEVRSIFIGQGF